MSFPLKKRHGWHQNLAISSLKNLILTEHQGKLCVNTAVQIINDLFYWSAFLRFAEANKMVYDSTRMLPLNCKHPNVSDEHLQRRQETNAIATSLVEVVVDAKVIRRQNKKEAKDVVHTTLPISSNNSRATRPNYNWKIFY